MGYPPMAMRPPYGMAYPQQQQPMNKFTFLYNLTSPSQNTLVMVKNIPGKYTRERFRLAIDETFQGQYDFLFLPAEPRGEHNRQLAFINFRTQKQAAKFCRLYHGSKANDRFPCFPSN